MIVWLPSDLEKLVEQKVKSGGYQTPDEVVAEGLRLLQQRDQSAQEKLEALRDAIRIGRKSGPAEAFAIESVKAEPRHAFENRRRRQKAMASFTRHPQAKRDLIEIWTYIADYNPAAADRVLHKQPVGSCIPDPIVSPFACPKTFRSGAQPPTAGQQRHPNLYAMPKPPRG